MGFEDWQQTVKPEDMAYHALDYIRHIQWVTQGLLLMQGLLSERILTHDRSKIVDGMERNVYAAVVPEFYGKQFGTDDHKAVGAKLGPAWQHHLEHNRHHPEHFENGINGMTLIDLIEMLCDWKSAGLREEKDSLYRSIDMLKDRHNIGPQLEAILINTVALLHDVKKHPAWSQKEDNAPPFHQEGFTT